jgi:metal-responsive CopG/Arc/MetJ family transcriptional regulator
MSRRKTKTIPVYLKDKLLAEVEAIAEELGISQSEVLRHAFIEYLRNKNKLQTL